jgi:xanthine dehydrogenase accessory factor
MSQRDVFSAAYSWLSEGVVFAFATLVSTDRRGLATPGTTIAVDLHGTIVGSIGGGCYEADAIRAAAQTAKDGLPRNVVVRLDDDIFGGTGCGAQLTIATWVPSHDFMDDARAIAQGDRAVALRVTSSPSHAFEVAAPAPLIVVGATCLAAAIASIARHIDFRTTIVDPRPSFANAARLSDAHRILCAWPDEVLPELLSRPAPVIVVSHDPKIDLPSLACALRLGSPYIALLGSRRAQASRRKMLQGEGFRDEEIARIHGPAGLDLGGFTTGETAIAILAELIAVSNDRGGGGLRDAVGPIHTRTLCGV